MSPTGEMAHLTVALPDKVAIVTGAGGDVGRAITHDLLGAGARVVWVGRHVRRLRALVDMPPEQKDRSLMIRADVRSEEDVRRLVRVSTRRFGRIDILVNNAGARGPTAPVTKLRRSDWDEVLDTNLTGPFLCARECLKHMMPRGQGCIVNIASMAGLMAYPLRAAYAASKWGLVGLTLTLAQEAGASNVLVNAICPGPVDGPVMDSVIAKRARAVGVSAEAMRQQYVRPSALGRMVDARDVSRMVLFLCSDAARNLTGQVLEVSAGFGLCPM